MLSPGRTPGNGNDWHGDADYSAIRFMLSTILYLYLNSTSPRRRAIPHHKGLAA